MDRTVKRFKHPWWIRDGNQFQRFYKYMTSLDAEETNRHEIDDMILKGALRPTPTIQAAINRITGKGEYAAIHLRHEPDFLCHFAGLP
jgi:hypothetical protein